MQKNARKFWLFAAIFLVLTITMLIVLKPLNQDEGVFLTIARGLFSHQLPYRDFFDHKPPGIYFLLSPFVYLNNPLWPKLLFVVITLISAGLIYKISNVIVPRSGLISVAFWLFAAIFFEGNFMVAEPVVALLLLASVYLILTGGNIWLIGLLAGSTLLFKQTALFSILALFIIFWTQKKSLRPSFWLGFISPIALLAIYLLAAGTWQEGWREIITLNLISYPRESFASVIRGLWPVFLLTFPLWITFVLSFWQKQKRPGGFFYFLQTKKRKEYWLLLLLIISPLPVLLFRHYPHYWLQILPFAAILAGICLARKKSIWQIVLGLCILALAGFQCITLINDYLPKMRGEKEVTNYLESRPEQFLLCENQFSPYYFLANKKSLNRYLYLTEVNVGGESQTINDLKRVPAVLILWPADPDFAYAKTLQNEITSKYEKIQSFPKIGMDIYISTAPDLSL